MTLFRGLNAVIFLAIVAYTAVTVSQHGLNLLPVFFGDMMKMGWPGQFNFDFFCFLILSATWVSWRHHFSAAGLALGLVAFFGGALFLSAYLFVHAGRVQGDAAALLLGEARARQA